VTIVMGLDQHRAQITAEWLDTSTGEIGRARVMPAHRAAVRRFVERFRGLELEVALEATTGWRFVVEELRRVGASVHLAEPAETGTVRAYDPRSIRPTGTTATVPGANGLAVGSGGAREKRHQSFSALAVTVGFKRRCSR
jgi:hypothetical protein